MLLRLLRRLGLLRTTLLLVVASVVVSAAMTALLMGLWFGGSNPQSLLLSIVVPAVCAPLFTYTQLHLSQKLEEARSELRRLSITDDLTGAYNRRHFLQLAEVELNRARRYGTTFSLLILDLDDFKAINDRYGHLGGDQVLRGVSGICRSGLREGDVFARLGGEEFVLLLPHTNRSDAPQAAERLRRRIADEAPRWEGALIPLTASVGVTAFEPGVVGVYEMLAAADQALYAAKAAGKNRVAVAHGTGSTRGVLVEEPVTG